MVTPPTCNVNGVNCVACAANNCLGVTGGPGKTNLLRSLLGRRKAGKEAASKWAASVGGRASARELELQEGVY